MRLDESFNLSANGEYFRPKNLQGQWGNYYFIKRDSCAGCGQPYMMDKYSRSKSKLYCSLDCSRKNYRTTHETRMRMSIALKGNPKVIKNLENHRALKRLPNGTASFNLLYIRYKKGATSRGLSFELSKEEFKEIVGMNCFYCGDAPKNVIVGSKRINGGFRYSGIDRVDNSMGYLKTNIVACCRTCNVSKNNHSKDDFLDWIKRVYTHSLGKES